MSDEIRAKIYAILNRENVHFSVRYMGETVQNTMGKNQWECDSWRVKFEKVTIPSKLPGTSSFDTDYFTGLGHRKANKRVGKNPINNPHSLAAIQWDKVNLRPVDPVAADVLYSLVLDSSAADMCFQDWASEYGYSEDSISALNIYTACVKIGKDMQRIFGRAVMDELAEALQDY